MLWRLTAKDIPWIANFMRIHYPPAYAYLWDDDGAWYVKNMYSEEKLAEEFTDERAEFYQVIYVDQAVGYCKIMRDKKPINADSGRYLYTQRLYLATEAQGKGIGGRLMRLIVEHARTDNFDYCWLETMEVGDSRRFYERLGFKETGKIRLPFPGMVEELRGLITMVKPISKKTRHQML
ncbi:hypothetical protein CEQ90_16995 [Lewinellaceae bacterium SD302]|nr:hypothetical protein CEQ90_16995 [Lewinellaceae bacterium SD302]